MVVITSLFFFQPSILQADETASPSTGVSIPVLQSIHLSPGSFIFPDVSSTNLDKGFLEARDAATVTVSSNVAWQLTIQSEDPNMGKVKNNVKPLSDFLWKKSNDSHYTTISTDGKVVDSNSEYADQQKIKLDYKMLVGWTKDAPGTYGLNLRFRLSTLE
ncbi:hypothetical protein [Desulfocicer vacuolatum]|nr:hypothetical protein [Desulfocicer vacuolatum]